MNRRSLLLGLGALIAAPAVIRTAGLLMPVRMLSAEERDPGDINGIIAELPDGATWKAKPGVRYWVDGKLKIHGKRGVCIDFNREHIDVRDWGKLIAEVTDSHDVTVKCGTFHLANDAQKFPSHGIILPGLPMQRGFFTSMPPTSLGLARQEAIAHLVDVALPKPLPALREWMERDRRPAAIERAAA